MNFTPQTATMIDAGLASIGLTRAGASGGTGFGSLVMTYARNSSLELELFAYTILGFPLSEAVSLFALMIEFLILST